MTITSLESREGLIKAMQSPDFYDHEVAEVSLIQTHISWVFLTGKYAYKVKKPMDFGFLNFTELSQRKHFCEQEIRLNKRLADDIYLETVAITGSEQNPVLNGDDDIIEYAVKMKQFDQSKLVDKLLAADKLTAAHIDDIADQAAHFHLAIDVSGNTSELGTADSVNAPVIQNFDQLDPLIKDTKDRDQLARLRQWSETEYEHIQQTLSQRKADGFIRECHGDMHLGNMALINNKITIFDGIEFNDDFRWIDVMSEVAFLVMDLIDRGASHFAFRFLNRYLEKTGDYQGLSVLRFYLVYRAMVRAKIASFTLLTPDLPEKDVKRALEQYQSYSNLAERFISIKPPVLAITHGVSGSGKTTVSQDLLEKNQLIRIRSDVERKRLFNLDATAKTKSAQDAGIYTTDATENTYRQMEKFAKIAIQSGFSVILDATFLEYEFRKSAKNLATECGVEFEIIELEADPDVLKQRIIKRREESDNASEADLEILENQLSNFKPLEADETAFVKRMTG